jgi:hypothetical protein
LAEDLEEYELDILDGFGTALRSVTGLTSKSYTYSAANQATDFPAGYVDKTSSALVNPSFEVATTNPNGKVEGWTFETNAAAIKVRTGVYGNIAGAQSGSNYLSMDELTTASSARIYQDIDVSGYSYIIDYGSVLFRAGAYVAAHDSATDTGRIDILFLDKNKTVLSTVTGTERDPDNTGAWTQYKEAGTAPLGTRFVRIALNGTQVSSSLGVEVVWDNVTLEVDEGSKNFLSVVVYQMSEQVGRGFPSIKQIEVI